MMMPSIFENSLFDDFMDDFSFPGFWNADRASYGKQVKSLMKTDVKETDNGYEVDMDLPGFEKDEIKLQLNQGYLNISAAKGVDKDEKDKDGKYVRRERYVGSMSRSFYVGDNVTEEDIHPKYENGILSFTLPKQEQRAVEEKNHYIPIEG